MLTKLSIFEGPREPALLDFSVADLLDVQSTRHGDRIAIVSLHQNARRTYSGLRDRVQTLASRLLQNNIKPGDRIVLLAGNCIEFVEIFLAVAAVGAISVLVAPTLAVDEVQDAVKSVGRSFMITEGDQTRPEY